MWKNNLLVLPIVFVGILGVIGIFDDISLLLGQERWEESKVFVKYYGATLGTVGFAFVQYKIKKRRDDINT